MWFGLKIGFIDHLQAATTNNYNTIANFHTLQITTAHAMSFQFDFASSFRVTDLNSWDSSTAPTNSSVHKILYNLLTTKLVSVIISQLGPRENTVLPLLLQWFLWERVCLRRRYPVTAVYTCILEICCLAANVVSLFVSRSLPSNGCARYCILSRVGGYAWRKLRVLVRMIGFISTSITISLNYN
jgi:hypothetical protein